MKNTRIPEKTIVTSQTGMFHFNTLDPSNGGIGKRLNNARNALILVPNKHIIAINEPVPVYAYEPSELPTAMNIKARTMFTRGPHMEIIPFVLSSIYWL